MSYKLKVWQTLFLLLILVGCNTKTIEREIVIPADHLSSALTIGWYVPVESLVELVGSAYSPRVVNDKNESAVLLVIVKSEEHSIDAESMGAFKEAHLLIPVDGRNDIDCSNKFVCPLIIVEQSQQYGDRLNEAGFKVYTGKIALDVRYTGEKYMTDASVSTYNGLIEIKGMFEEAGEDDDLEFAVFNPKGGSTKYMMGEQNMKHFDNGKGNLNTNGNNIIKAMSLSGRPYFLKLDENLSMGMNIEGN